MTNLLIGLHGIKQDVDKAIKWLETRFLPIKVKHPDGKEEQVQLQLRVSEIKLLHLSYGKENHDVMINTLNPSERLNFTDGKGKGAFSKAMGVLRKALKLKKIGKVDETKGKLLLPNGLFDNLRVIGIGYKDDIEMQFPNGLTHEAI